jgi:hypothetical protein
MADTEEQDPDSQHDTDNREKKKGHNSVCGSEAWVMCGRDATRQNVKCTVKKCHKKHE